MCGGRSLSSVSQVPVVVRHRGVNVVSAVSSVQGAPHAQLISALTLASTRRDPWGEGGKDRRALEALRSVAYVSVELGLLKLRVAHERVLAAMWA